MTTRRAVHANWKQAGVSLALCVCAFAILWTVRSQGGLEYLELKTYDALLRSERRDYSFASRFLIVGMNDADIKEYGFPIPDQTLKKLIAKLQEAQPRTIGVDIVRDMPEPSLESRKAGSAMNPGWNTELRDFLKEDSNWNVSWVVIPLASDVMIGAPVPEAQYGFAEVPQDVADESVRRGMLQVWDRRSGKKYQSLAFQMAMNYLEQESPPIYPQPVPGNAELVKVGPAVIPRCRANDGAYVGNDDRGYKYLLDYRGPRDLPRVSVADILHGRAHTSAIHDKIIVIGVTTLSNKDLLRTPVNDQMFGVVFQAISAEHLLRYALRGAHPITCWSD
ncbi:MAG TPA: CHASE2 domain-containing protein, partial [Humisphaera sp.]|nr:CHASE2 domain-containing protein [Humisphaera sp.]